MDWTYDIMQEVRERHLNEDPLAVDDILMDAHTFGQNWWLDNVPYFGSVNRTVQEEGLMDKIKQWEAAHITEHGGYTLDELKEAHAVAQQTRNLNLAIDGVTAGIAEVVKPVINVVRTIRGTARGSGTAAHVADTELRQIDRAIAEEEVETVTRQAEETVTRQAEEMEEKAAAKMQRREQRREQRELRREQRRESRLEDMAKVTVISAAANVGVALALEPDKPQEPPEPQGNIPVSTRDDKKTPQLLPTSQTYGDPDTLDRQPSNASIGAVDFAIILVGALAVVLISRFT